MKSQKEKEEDLKKKSNVIDLNKFRAKEDVKDTVEEIPIGSKPITPAELEEELEDAFLMGKQEAVYQTVATFLSTPEAIKFKITGVRIAIEDGYINCYWEFGERGVPNGGEQRNN